MGLNFHQLSRCPCWHLAWSAAPPGGAAGGGVVGGPQGPSPFFPGPPPPRSPPLGAGAWGVRHSRLKRPARCRQTAPFSWARPDCGFFSISVGARGTVSFCTCVIADGFAFPAAVRVDSHHGPVETLWRKSGPPDPGCCSLLLSLQLPLFPRGGAPVPGPRVKGRGLSPLASPELKQICFAFKFQHGLL